MLQSLKYVSDNVWLTAGQYIRPLILINFLRVISIQPSNMWVSFLPENLFESSRKWFDSKLWSHELSNFTYHLVKLYQKLALSQAVTNYNFFRSLTWVWHRKKVFFGEVILILENDYFLSGILNILTLVTHMLLAIDLSKKNIWTSNHVTRLFYTILN